ncbi:phosphoribosylamine--glycine ligase [Gammaproteobacteria bacterium]|nr:phosphoribosylamine--glycine ligase [Gammaproteobacteria bacterium]
MKVLVVGEGGREHALSWKIAQSPKVTKVYVAPGNGGTEQEALLTNINIKSDDINELASFAMKEQIDLTIIGPEDPLVHGITDKFKALGLKCFGPSKDASQLEGSKEFMKDFLQKNNIPTADYQTFTDATKAIEFVKKTGCPIVIKADGLAAGKGVTIALTLEEATNAINQSLESEIFGKAGKKIVIEEYLEGEEASFIVITDGITAIPFASSQDHKTRDEMDLGPNTGGMGAYSPAPIVDEVIHNKIMNQVIYPTLEGIRKEGYQYCGFLYAGMMIDKENRLKVLEFNCRFGDPETQPIMMRLKSDLAEICDKACDLNLKNEKLEWDERKAIGVVMASKGYPFQYEKNKPIKNIPLERDDLKVFHAGTKLDSGLVKSNGGRVLCITTLGESVESAQKKAYDAVSKIEWENAYYRKDIGYKAVERELNELS